MKTAINLFTLLVCGLLLFGCATHATFEAAQNSYEDGEYYKSFKLVEQLAKEGDPRSQYALGYFYYYGLGAPKDEILGVAWITKSAQMGNAHAQTALARIYESQNIGVDNLMENFG